MLLKAETRKKILKLPFARELTNYYVNFKNKKFYKKINKSNNFTSKIISLKNENKSTRCFIVGSGPSLTIEQLKCIKDEISFGSNRIYKMFDKTQWRPKYYVIQDAYDPTPRENYEKLDVENLFVSDYYWRENGMNNKNAICFNTKRMLKQSKNIPFSDDFSNYVQTASTVTFTMIELAVYLGFKEIYLIGMDHSYSNVTNDKGEIISKNSIRSHVFDDEKPNEVVANISYMEDAYKSAKDYCDINNIKIYNATLGGHLEIFERIDFFNIFNRKEGK